MSNDLHLRNLAVPFLSQRKNGYLWKECYTEEEAEEKGNLSLAGEIKPDGNKISMACRSCNITCVTMVLRYFGITNESPDDLMRRYFERNDSDKALLNNAPHAVNALEKYTHFQKLIDCFYASKGVTTKVALWGKDNPNCEAHFLSPKPPIFPARFNQYLLKTNIKERELSL